MPGPFGAPLFVGQPPGAGGAPGTGDVIVATEASASAVAGLIDGQGVFILSHRSWWRSDPSFAGALVAHVAIARAGGGALLRSPYADPSWREAITDIYIDPGNVTGIANDENKAIFDAPQVGAARLPLLTWQELFRRWGTGNVVRTGDLVNLTVQIHVLSSTPGVGAGNDPASFDFIAGVDTFLRVIGEAPTTLLGPSALGAFTAQNPAVPAPGGTAPTITIGATVWGPFIGKRIRRTSDGSVAVILRDLGGGTARISQPQLTNEALFAVSPTNVVWAAADVVVVEDLTEVNLGAHFRYSFEGSAFGFGGQVNFLDIDVMNASGSDFQWAPQVGENALIVAYQCGFDRTANQDSSLALNSCAHRTFYFGQMGQGQGAMYGGAILPPVGFPIAAEITRASGQFFNFGVLDFFTYCQGGAVITRGSTTCGTFSIWDATVLAALNPGGHALLVGGGPNLGAGASALALRSGNPIFGSGSVGKGCRVAAGSEISAYQTLPNITGATGDFQLGDSVIGAWGDFVTGVYQPPGGIALTWAALIAAAGVAGFGGSAHNPIQDAHVNDGAAT